MQKPIRRRQVTTFAAVPFRWCTSPRGPVPTGSFIPRCRRFPFPVRCIFGSRALLSFPVDDGGVNDTALFQQAPLLGQAIPDLPNGRCASRRRKSGSSSRPEPSPDSPRQSARRSPPRKQVLHHRIAWVAEQLHAQHRRQRMRLSPLAAALRTRRSNASLQARLGDRAVHPLRKDLAARPALLAVAFKVHKGQLPKVLHVMIPKKGVVQDSRHAPDAQCRTHISGYIQRFSRLCTHYVASRAWRRSGRWRGST